MLASNPYLKPEGASSFTAKDSDRDTLVSTTDHVGLDDIVSTRWPGTYSRLETSKHIVALLEELLNNDVDLDQPNTKFVNFYRYILEDPKGLIPMGRERRLPSPLCYSYRSVDPPHGYREHYCFLLADRRTRSVDGFFVLVYTKVTRYSWRVRCTLSNLLRSFLPKVLDCPVRCTRSYVSRTFLCATLCGTRYIFSPVDLDVVGDLEQHLSLAYTNGSNYSTPFDFFPPRS
jgi:hypothetical protein